MPDVFINYRTNDEKETALRIHGQLSRRFGASRIFLAGVSIPPGDDFTKALRAGVRRSAVLLAVIGQQWLSARDGAGRVALESKDDWVRQEILIAFRNQITVVPVFVDETPRLTGRDLPPALRQLAKCQSVRYRHRRSDEDLADLVSRLVKLVPELTDTTPSEPTDPTMPGRTAAMGGNTSIIHNPTGPVHSGSGNQINMPLGGTPNLPARRPINGHRPVRPDTEPEDADR